MTIILATHDLMVADSHTRWGDASTTDPRKVRRFGTDLVGVSGDWALSGAFFAAWEQYGHPTSLATTSDRSIDALILHQQCLYWTDHTSEHLHPLYEPVWVIGSAMFLVLGAVWGGASILDAMAIGCERGEGCDWPLRWYSLDGREGIVARSEWYDRLPTPGLLDAHLFPRHAPMASARAVNL